jgi:streptogramin lyase
MPGGSGGVVKRMMRLSLLAAVLMFAAAGCGNSNSGSAAQSDAESFSSGGIYPEGIGVDSSDNVWVANRYSNNVVELNVHGKILGTFAVGLRPHGLKINRKGNGNIWVENTAGGGPGGPAACPGTSVGTVTELDGSGTLVGTFCTGGDGPQHADFDGNGNVWVSNQGSGTISELSTANGNIERIQAVGETPHAIALDSSGNPWVGNYNANTVTQFQAANMTLVPFALPGSQPTGNAFDPAGNLWQSVQSVDQVAKVNPTQNPAGPFPSFSVGVAPRGVTIDGGGNVFVANQRTNDVFQFSQSGQMVKRLKVGACPENMAIDSDGDLWVSDACANTVTVLRRIAQPISDGDGDSNG